MTSHFCFQMCALTCAVIQNARWSTNGLTFKCFYIVGYNLKMDPHNLYLKTSLVALIVGIVGYLKTKKRKRKVWTRPWLLRRNNGRGVLAMVSNELRLEYPLAYKNFLTMNHNTFLDLLKLVYKDIKKKDTNMREAISPENR